MRRREALAAIGVVSLPTVASRSHGSGSGRTVRPARPAHGPAYAPLATLPIEGARELVVGSAGKTAYLAVEDGIAVVDVADPADPRLLAERRGLLASADDGPMRDIQDVAIDGDRLLAVGPAHPGVSGPRAAVLFDVTDPSVPRRVAVHRTTSVIHNATLQDGRAYLTARGRRGGRLDVVSLPDGTRLGSWSPIDADAAWADVPASLRVCHDVRVHGDRAYAAVWDAGTWLLDVADPAAPTAIGRVGQRSPAELAAVEDADVESTELPGNHHTVALDPGRALLAVGREAWDADGDGDGGPGGIDLVDVSAPSRPAVVGRIAPPPTTDATVGGTWTTAHNLALAGGRLYSAWYQGGVRVHDVSDPSAPEARVAWGDPAVARFWAARLAASGVVASSMGSTDAEAGLYTFPTPGVAGDGRAVSGNVAPRPSGTPGDRVVTATPSLDGFGAGVAAVGLTLAAWLARGRRHQGD